jgi:hypothetical protein
MRSIIILAAGLFTALRVLIGLLIAIVIVIAAALPSQSALVL